MKKIGFILGFAWFFAAQNIQEYITGQYDLPGWFFVENNINNTLLLWLAYIGLYNAIGLILMYGYKKISKKGALSSSQILAYFIFFNLGMTANFIFLLLRLQNTQWIL